MIELDKERLYAYLKETYEKNHPKSKAFYERAKKSLIGGGSHNLRLIDPFPFYDVSSRDAEITDKDGITYIDFWQGHFANILGHNPDIVCEALEDLFRNRQGLETGFPGLYQTELAEVIRRQTGAEKIRFTTSGTLASMYCILLSKSFTGRDIVLKVGGGWHGAQPYALKGITSMGTGGLELMESAGLSAHIESSIVMTRFNDVEDLEDKFQRFGDRLACLIVEPFLGAGGFIFGRKDYIQRARELTEHHGTILIFDEVISGFRFHARGVQSLYGIVPDLSLFGKAIGGGMPASAVAGRGDILSLCDSSAPVDKRVKFEGGTFSAHPASMTAGVVFLNHLIKNEEKIYNKIGKLGETARAGIEKTFQGYGFNVRCTGGDQKILPQSSLVGVNFLHDHIDRITSPEQVWNPAQCDPVMREKIFKLAMLNEGFNIFHGYGAVSYAHSEQNIQASLDAVDRVAQLFLQYKK
ncbi:MAG: aminotransferase class III-fold pyridoxal phosphate-dependent enzyme [Candidatus Aminicenantes bacterium]|nr:aminotransferase class III-fold pyridoxal phosphate-dependent enzyme [Candidatus Aminicenantes bacterium]